MSEPTTSAPAPHREPEELAKRPSAPARLLAEVLGLFRGVDLPAAVAACVATSALIVTHHQGDTSFFRSHFLLKGNDPLTEYLPYLYWHLASFAMYLAVPLAAAALTPGERVRSLGLGLGDWRFGLKATGLILAVFVPVVFAASRFPAFSGHYPLCSAARSSAWIFAAYQLSFALYFVAWEFLFRGYLLFSLERCMGKMAVFAQMMPFAIIHFGKPQAEVFGAIVAAIALGVLALRTRSCWYGALIHIGAALSMDLFVSVKALAP